MGEKAIMSNFTITPPIKATVITLEEDLKGQVDIMAQAPNGISCRIAAFGNGRLHLFRISLQVAESLGLKLDAEKYAAIRRA